MDVIPIWVRLPALPLHFWDLYHFRRIGDILGAFLEADLSYLETNEKKVARILVNLNLREGLAEYINMDWGSMIIPQLLDYENVPFRCRRFHAYGHPVSACTLPVCTLNGSRRKGAPACQEGTSEKIAVTHGNAQTSADDLGNDPVCEDPIPSGPVVDEGPSEQPSQASVLDNVISPRDPTRLGISSLPFSSNVNLFLNNVSFLGFDWIEGLRKLSLSGHSGPSMPLPVPFIPTEAAPGLDAHPAAAITAFDLIPSVEEPSIVVLEPDPKIIP